MLIKNFINQMRRSMFLISKQIVIRICFVFKFNMDYLLFFGSSPKDVLDKQYGFLCNDEEPIF